MIKKLYLVSLLFFTAISTLVANPFKQELAADKAQHQSFWRAYAKSYPIDPTLQQSLQSLVNELAALMEVEGVTVRIAEANKLNTFLSKELDCTNTDNSYSIDLFGNYKSITIGEDFIDEASVEQLSQAIAHELAHIKNDDFTKRFIVSYAYLLVAVAVLDLGRTYLDRSASASDTGKKILNLSFAGILTGSLLAIGIALLSSAAQQEQDADSVAEKYLAQLSFIHQYYQSNLKKF